MSVYNSVMIMIRSLQMGCRDCKNISLWFMRYDLFEDIQLWLPVSTRKERSYWGHCLCTNMFWQSWNIFTDGCKDCKNIFCGSWDMNFFYILNFWFWCNSISDDLIMTSQLRYDIRSTYLNVNVKYMPSYQVRVHVCKYVISQVVTTKLASVMLYATWQED